MSISKSLSVIEQQLPRLQVQFDEARKRCPELETFVSPSAVRAALHAKSSMPPAQRYAVINAMLTEHRARPHALWSSLLLLAFGPMLNTLRAGLGKPGDEDEDMRVIGAFLEAVSALPASVGQYAPIALRRATAKELFAKEPEPELVSFDEQLHSPWDPFQMSELEEHAEMVWARRREEREEAARKAVQRGPHERLRKLPKQPRRRHVAA